MIMKRTRKSLLSVFLLCTVVLIWGTVVPVAAQDYRKAITPKLSWGGAINFDTNHPAFSASGRVMAQIGTLDDVLNVNFGVGYRGYFDREPPAEFIYHASFSDYMLYSNNDGHDSHVRPMGGQVVLPAELHLSAIELGEDTRLFAGIGVEYGIRLYQSKRYARYYGAHVMNSNSIAFYPMLGVKFGDEDFCCTLSLYWRHHTQCAFNDKELDIDKFTAKNFFGLQLTAAF